MTDVGIMLINVLVMDNSEKTTHPKYFGVPLDRTLSYKQHIQNTKMKVGTRNNILKKFANSK